MAYDSRNDRVILFGGDGSGGALLSDTWAYSYATNACPWTDGHRRPDLCHVSFLCATVI